MAASKKAATKAAAPPVSKANCGTCNHAASFHRDGGKCFVGGCSCKKLVSSKKATPKKK